LSSSKHKTIGECNLLGQQRGTLLHVVLSSIQDSPDASMIVGFILDILTPGGTLRQTPI